jgi:hypothetical protein
VGNGREQFIWIFEAFVRPSTGKSLTWNDGHGRMGVAVHDRYEIH